MSNSTHETAACARCQQVKAIRARRLCRACYRQVFLDGTIEDWPGVRTSGFSRESELDISRRGSWVKRGGVKRWVAAGKNNISPVRVVSESGRR